MKGLGELSASSYCKQQMLQLVRLYASQNVSTLPQEEESPLCGCIHEEFTNKLVSYFRRNPLKILVNVVMFQVEQKKKVKLKLSLCFN
jgi:hypothetical protein